MLDYAREIRKAIVERGLKLVYISDQLRIPYQRLNRIFNQGAKMTASELIALCSFLKIDPNKFIDKAS